MKTALSNAALIIALSVNVSAYSQEANNEDVEVVEVYGAKPYSAWKKEWLASREKITNYLNDSIDNTDFKINCRRVSVPNSNVKKRICTSGYDSRIRKRVFEDAFYLGAGGFFVAQTASEIGSTEIARKKEEHLAIIEKIYVEDENFRDLFNNHLQLKEGYQNAHVAKFGSFSQFNQEPENEQESEQ